MTDSMTSKDGIISKIIELYKKQDYKGMSMQTHSFKGQCRYFQITKFIEIANELQQASYNMNDKKFIVDPENVKSKFYVFLEECKILHASCLLTLYGGEPSNKSS